MSSQNQKPEIRNPNQSRIPNDRKNIISSFSHSDLIRPRRAGICRHSGFGFLVFLALLTACSPNPEGPTTRPAFLSAPASEASPDYWWNKPNVTSVTTPNFDKLWQACVDTLVFDQFELNEQDRRFGALTTYPMISKQFFEFWRSDAGDLHEIAQDSLQTIRRTVHIYFARNPDGQFVAYPKVLMEQLSHPERRITAQAQFSQAFASTYEMPNRTTDQGATVPNRYWYSIGRDNAMEKQLARAVEQRLGEKSETRTQNNQSTPKHE